MPVKKKEKEESKIEELAPTSEEKAEEKKPSLKAKLSKFAKIFFGIIFILGGIFLVWLFLSDFIVLIKGAIGVFVILIGLLLIFLGWTD
ncbi:MAG: hypothetical protein ACP5IJ_01065 [Candidatus Nanoarchaeia archaeon]